MAAKINECFQGVVDSKATLQNEKGTLNALLDQQASTKGAYLALLKKQSEDKLTDVEKASMPGAEAALNGFDARISAQRKLVAEAEKSVTAAEQAHEAEKQRIAAEDIEIAKRPSRIEVAPPNAQKDRFATFGEQLLAVQRASRPGAQPDPRLFAASGLNETVPSEGGFLVQQEFSNTIWEKSYEVGELIKRAFRIPLTNPNSNGIKIPAGDETSRADGSRYGGVQVFWTEEGGLKTASKPAFRQMDLKLKKVAGIVYTTDELVEDAGALQAFIQRVLPIELRFAVENAFVNGTGAGQPLGYMNSGAVISVAKETGQLAATVLYENVLKMWSRMWAPSRASAVWLISQNVEPQLYAMSLAVGTGGVPVYLPAGGASSAPFATLFGRPVIASEYTATLGTQGDIQLVDMNEYVYIEKGGIKSDSSMHVRFLYDEMTFRFVYRVDGQPAWNSAITPRNGGDTLSPFVVLDTRA